MRVDYTHIPWYIRTWSKVSIGDPRRCKTSLVAQSAWLPVPRSPVRFWQKLRKSRIQLFKVEHIELRAKLLDCFLRSNKSNLNQSWVPSIRALPGFPCYYTPPLCVSAVIGALAVWRQNNNNKKDCWKEFLSKFTTDGSTYMKVLPHPDIVCTKSPDAVPVPISCNVYYASRWSSVHVVLSVLSVHAKWGK